MDGLKPSKDAFCFITQVRWQQLTKVGKYEERSEMNFLFTATGLSWRQGQEECERLGGYLAEIKAQEQQDFLVRANKCDQL